MGFWGVREEKVQNDSWVLVRFRGIQGPWGVPGCHLVLLG